MIYGMGILSFLIVFIISIIPLINLLVITKLYNLIQGVITYLFTSYLICFLCIELMDIDSILSVIQYQSLINVFSLNFDMITGFINVFVGKTTYPKYVTLTIVSIIYIISQMISTILKRKNN